MLRLAFDFFEKHARGLERNTFLFIVSPYGDTKVFHHG